MMIPNSVWAIVAIVLLLQGCAPDYEQVAAQRSEYAQNTQNDIVVVAIEESGTEKTDYIKGIQLAVKVINGRPERLLGRTLRLEIEEGGEDLGSTLPVLRKIATDPRVTAVLGHRKSSIAVPASVIYEASHIVFLPPFSTVKGLTNHNFQFTFRMIPSNLVMGKQLASIAKVLGYQKIVSLYDYTDYNRDAAFSFEDAALDQELNFIFRSSFSEKEEDYRSLISRFQNEDFDAVFLSTNTESAARMVQQLREMGIEMPVLSGDGIKPKPFSQAAGLSGDHTIIPTIYRYPVNTAINQRFKRQYKAHYKTKPDYNAAQGYDSVMLLAAAIERAQSTIPTTLSSTLRYIPYWYGTTGLHAFNSAGDIIGKRYYFQVMKSRKWHIIPAIHIAYNLEKFEDDERVLKPDTTITNFRQQFAQRLHPIDFKIHQFDLLHEVLHYNRLGWVYDSSDSEASLTEQKWLETLAEKKHFTLKNCGIPFATYTQKEARQGLFDCYGRLAPQVDVIYISTSLEMDPVLIKRLNRALKTYEVPTLAFRTDHKPLNMGITLELDRADIKISSPKSIAIFSGLLTKLKAFELVDRLANMPLITADLKALSDYGYLDSKDLLTLSPVPAGPDTR